MHKTIKLPIACFLLLSFVCNNLYAWGDPKLSGLGGQKGNQLYLYLLDNDNKWPPKNTSQPLKNYIEESAHLLTTIQDSCYDKPADEVQVQQMAAAGAAILAAGGKLLFDLYMDAKIRKNEELKNAAQASYSEKIVLSDVDLKKAKCALIVRDAIKNGDSKKENVSNNKARALGLVILIKLENKDQAFVMYPLYVKANNAVAVTKEGENKEGENRAYAEINISIAASTKGIGKQESGVPGLFPVGQGVFSMANIPLGLIEPSDSYLWCNGTKACPTSDLIVYPNRAPASITFMVSESGKVGFDVDQYIIELKAIKEAMGPAIKEALTEHLK